MENTPLDKGDVTLSTTDKITFKWGKRSSVARIGGLRQSVTTPGVISASGRGTSVAICPETYKCVIWYTMASPAVLLQVANHLVLVDHYCIVPGWLFRVRDEPTAGALDATGFARVNVHIGVFCEARVAHRAAS
ncbi:MAG: hypothetical protein E6I14_10985 [Chloroflexi bacterium]|nr:MAG: hypothetical protein E6I14_10985 [Chloroflexota bacterium]